MSYVAMYRRWRPQCFDDIVGQAHVVRTLKNAISSGRITHAYLFAGPRGTGKTSTARLLAKSLNCEKGPTADPCGECASCVAVREGTAMDVIEIDAASNRGIDEMRDLREKVVYAPSQGRYKVYIIDEAHMLTPQAFNALLKTLEEPPPHAVFVLATTQAESILPTIVSRCQRFDFNRLTVAELAEHISRVAAAQSISVDPDAARLIARRAEGSARDALGLLEQAAAWSPQVTQASVLELLGVSDFEVLFGFAGAVAHREPGVIFQIVQEQVDAGADLRQFTSDVTGHFRNLLVAKEAPDRPELLELADDAYRAVAEQAAEFTRAELVTILETMSGAETALRRSSAPRLVLEIAAVGLCVQEQTQMALESAVLPKVDGAHVRLQRPAPPKPAQQPQKREEVDPAESIAGSEDGKYFGVTEAQWEEIRARVKVEKAVVDALLRQATCVKVGATQAQITFDPSWVVHAQRLSEPDALTLINKVTTEVLGRPIQCSVGTASEPASSANVGASPVPSDVSSPSAGNGEAKGGGKGRTAPQAASTTGVVRDAKPVVASAAAQAEQADLRNHPDLKVAVELFDPVEIRTISR